LPPEFAQWERAYQEELDQVVVDHRQYLTELPTDVKFVRFIRPDEYGQVHVDCLAKQGFMAKVDSDGGISYGDYPAEQTPALEMAGFRCTVEYPVHPRYSQQPTESQIKIIYDYMVKELVPCLAREGYQVDATSVPTWETFRATFQKDGSWAPYDTVIKKQNEERAANGGVAPKGASAEWERINKACPQDPPLDRLWP